MLGVRSRLATMTLAVGSLLLLTGAGKGGCGEGLDNRAGDPGIEVGGSAGATWAVDYSDTIEVKIKNAAGVVTTRSFTVAGGGTFDVEGLHIDLSQLCRRSDVACPHEVFPSQVTMTQPGTERHLLYVTYAKAGPLGSLSQQTLLGNVDSDDDFSIALGIGAATNGVCGLLTVSYATGHIDSDGGNPPRGVSLKGRIVTAYSGGCVILGSGGTAAAGVTVEIAVPFDAYRK